MGNVQKRILIQKINNLPTLPNVLTKIIELTESRSSNAKSLGDILSMDPSISSVILKLVNSAFYGNLRHVSSIHHATVILGFQMVKTIAMGVSIFQTRSSNHPIDREQLWIHSIGCANLARLLADRAPGGEKLDRDVIFLSGLLHDVGKVIFDNYFADEYKKVSDLVREEGIWIREAEERVLNMDHCEAGFYLGRKWQFPSSVVEAIRYHHHLEKASVENGFLCALVSAADYGCRLMSLGSGGDDTVPGLDPLVGERFGLTTTMIHDAVNDLEKDRSSFEAFVTEAP